MVAAGPRTRVGARRRARTGPTAAPAPPRHARTTRRARRQEVSPRGGRAAPRGSAAAAEPQPRPAARDEAEEAEPAPAPAGQGDDDDADQDLSGWNIPTWQELIASLYRPQDR